MPQWVRDREGVHVLGVEVHGGHAHVDPLDRAGVVAPVDQNVRRLPLRQLGDRDDGAQAVELGAQRCDLGLQLTFAHRGTRHLPRQLVLGVTLGGVRVVELRAQDAVLLLHRASPPRVLTRARYRRIASFCRRSRSSGVRRRRSALI